MVGGKVRNCRQQVGAAFSKRCVVYVQPKVEKEIPFCCYCSVLLYCVSFTM